MIFSLDILCVMELQSGIFEATKQCIKKQKESTGCSPIHLTKNMPVLFQVWSRQFSNEYS